MESGDKLLTPELLYPPDLSPAFEACQRLKGASRQAALDARSLKSSQPTRAMELVSSALCNLPEFFIFAVTVRRKARQALPRRLNAQLFPFDKDTEKPSCERSCNSTVDCISSKVPHCILSQPARLNRSQKWRLVADSKMLGEARDSLHLQALLPQQRTLGILWPEFVLKYGQRGFYN